MDDGRIRFLLFTGGILLILNLYVFQAIKTVVKNKSKRVKNGISIYYWGLTALIIFGIYYSQFYAKTGIIRNSVTVLYFVMVISELFVIPFLLVDDIRRSFIFFKNKITKRLRSATDPVTHATKEATLSRSEFLSKAGLIVAAVPFSIINFGMLTGAYDYKIRRVPLILPNLPSQFSGLKIIQISDIHSGSFYDKKAVMAGVEMLMKEKADAIFFTGDLVNDKAKEMIDYQDIFSKVKAPMGVYSVTGNHDYGDYSWWPNDAKKAKNFEDLKTTHANMGWNLLMNDHKLLTIGGESIAILGIENWGAAGRFPKYGKMDLAKKGTEDAAVKLLLSHDPSHWNAKITKEHVDIDAMFAGHTHGMQFGFQFGNLQWSPVQYMYPEWAGLYKNNHQQLYVNVGYGFIGYPGRVGILPEITDFELKKA